MAVLIVYLIYIMRKKIIRRRKEKLKIIVVRDDIKLKLILILKDMLLHFICDNHLQLP